MGEGLFHPEIAADPELFCRKGSGFYALVRHPSMEPEQIERQQARCFEEDFRRLGPSIYRSIETWLLGYQKLKASPVPILRLKAERLACEIRKAYPVFLSGRLFGPTAPVRRFIADLEARVHAELGAPSLKERLLSVAAVVMASWTALTLKLELFQHPSLIRHTFRLPQESRLHRAWRRLRRDDPSGHSVAIERRPLSTVWVRVEGRLAPVGAGRLAGDLREALDRRRERVVLDLERLAKLESEAAERMTEMLRGYRGRIRVVLPKVGEFASLAAVFTLYR